MPFYLGLPITICLWLVILVLTIIAIGGLIDLRRNITSYNRELDKAVKREIARMKTQENKL